MDKVITDDLMEKTFLFCWKKISDKEEAQDLAQEIIVDALLILRSGKKIENFYGLFWQIAHNKVVDFYRKKRPSTEPVKQSPSKTAFTPARESKPSFAPQRETRKSFSQTQTATDKLVSFDDGARKRSAKASGEVFVIRPQAFDDAQTVVDFMKRGKVIVINMEGLQLEPAQRIIDFIGGACDALDGSIQGISNNIFIAAPSNIAVTGDLREEILNESALSPNINPNINRTY